MANIRVTVCDTEQYDGDWPTPNYPTRLVDAIAWFKTKLKEIPVEYRDTARCTIDSIGGYESSHYGHIEISYDRPETTAEQGERLAKAEAQDWSLKERELAALRALKLKYPDAS